MEIKRQAFGGKNVKKLSICRERRRLFFYWYLSKRYGYFKM